MISSVLFLILESSTQMEGFSHWEQCILAAERVSSHIILVRDGWIHPIRLEMFPLGKENTFFQEKKSTRLWNGTYWTTIKNVKLCYWSTDTPTKVNCFSMYWSLFLFFTVIIFIPLYMSIGWRIVFVNKLPVITTICCHGDYMIENQTVGCWLLGWNID